MPENQTFVGEHVSFRFPALPKPLIEDATFRIRVSGPEPSRIGLIGPNGHGKTTLIRLLCQELKPDAGRLIAPPSLTIASLPQSILEDQKQQALQDFVQEPLQSILQLEQELREFEASMTSLEGPALEALLETYGAKLAIYEASDGYTLEHRVELVLEALGLKELEPDRRLKTLSVGQQTRAALARLLLSPADLLVLDEPTNHLDISACQWLEGYLNSIGRATLIVSHDRHFLDRTVHETWNLEHGVFETYPGNYSDYQEFCEKRRERLKHEYALQQREIKRLERSSQQRQGWSDRKESTKIGSHVMDRGFIGARAARQAKRAKHLELRIQQELEKRRAELPKIDRDVSLHFPMHQAPPQHLMRLHNIAHTRGGKVLFDDLQLDIKAGQRWSITGPNGSGKSTLLQIIAGELLPTEGTRRMFSGVTMHHYTQEHGELLLHQNHRDSTILQTIGATYADTTTRTLLAYLGFKKDDVFRPISELSPGQLARVALARALLSGANLLLLDEPTNHLDLRARKALEQGLRHYEGTLICVSHDRAFLKSLGSVSQQITLPHVALPPDA